MIQNINTPDSKIRRTNLVSAVINLSKHIRSSYDYFDLDISFRNISGEQFKVKAH